jgi:hypothetical protein
LRWSYILAYWEQIKRKQGDIRQSGGVTGDIANNLVLMELLIRLPNIAAPSLKKFTKSQTRCVEDPRMLVAA